MLLHLCFFFEDNDEPGKFSFFFIALEYQFFVIKPKKKINKLIKVISFIEGYYYL